MHRGGGFHGGGYHGRGGGYHGPRGYPGFGGPRYWRSPYHQPHIRYNRYVMPNYGYVYPVEVNPIVVTDTDAFDKKDTPYYMIGRKLVLLGQRALGDPKNYIFESQLGQPYLILNQKQNVDDYNPDRLKIYVNDDNIIVDVVWG